MRKRAKMRRESERRDVFERYIGEIAQAASAITGEDTKKLYDVLMVQAKKRTAIADLQLDDEGRKVQDEDPADQEGVIVVEAARGESAGGGGDRAGDEPAKASAEAGKVARSGGDSRGKKEAADAGPALIDVQPVKRSGAKRSRGGGEKEDAPVAEGARARGEAKAAVAKAPALSPPSATASTAGGASAGAAGSASADVKPKAKLKLRLNPKTGKLEPIEEGPRLF